MESNDDTYESKKEYEKNMYASGNAEDYMNEVEDEEEWNRVQADSSVKVDEAGERTGGKKFGLRDRYRVACACAYIIFFIPLIFDKEDDACRFHASQGALVHIIEVLAWLAGSLLSSVGIALRSVLIVWVAGAVSLVLTAAVIIFIVLGILSALSEKNTPLPLIGHLISYRYL